MSGAIVAALGAGAASMPKRAIAAGSRELHERIAAIAARTSRELAAIAEQQGALARSKRLPAADVALLDKQSRQLADLASAMRDVEDLIIRAGGTVPDVDCA